MYVTEKHLYSLIDLLLARFSLYFTRGTRVQPLVYNNHNRVEIYMISESVETRVTFLVLTRFFEQFFPSMSWDLRLEFPPDMSRDPGLDFSLGVSRLLLIFILSIPRLRLAEQRFLTSRKNTMKPLLISLFGTRYSRKLMPATVNIIFISNNFLDKLVL